MNSLRNNFNSKYLNCFNNTNNIEQQNKIKKKCVNCGSIDFVNENNCIICNDCGLQFKNASNKINDMQQNSNNDSIEYLYNIDKMENMNTCSININSNNNKLKKLQLWNRLKYIDRNFIDIINKVEEYCKNFDIDKSIIDNTKILLHKYINIKGIDNKNIIFRGNNKISILAACLFYGAKLNENPRSVKEIAEIFKLKSKNITKGCKILLNVFKFDNENKGTINKFDITYSKPYQFINRYKNNFNLSVQSIEIINNISIKIKLLNIVSDHQPKSIAAATL